MKYEIDRNLPDFPPTESWCEFVKMRKKIKRPMTEYAEKLMLKRLRAFVNDGQDAEEMLNQSILNCWQNIYPVVSEDRPSTVNNYKTANDKAKILADRLTGKTRNEPKYNIIDINEFPS